MEQWSARQSHKLEVVGSNPTRRNQDKEGKAKGKIRRDRLMRFREVQVPTDFGHATCGV